MNSDHDHVSGRVECSLLVSCYDFQCFARMRLVHRCCKIDCNSYGLASLCLPNLGERSVWCASASGAKEQVSRGRRKVGRDDGREGRSDEGGTGRREEGFEVAMKEGWRKCCRRSLCCDYVMCVAREAMKGGREDGRTGLREI